MFVVFDSGGRRQNIFQKVKIANCTTSNAFDRHCTFRIDWLKGAGSAHDAIPLDEANRDQE